MPEIPFTYAPISQRVANRVFGTTTLGQLATWDGLSARVNGGALRLELIFLVAYYSLLNGQLDAPLGIGNGMDSWYQTLQANNDCAVYLNPAWTPTATAPQDPRNGEILYYRDLTATDERWERLALDGSRTALVGGLVAAPEPWMRQGDAFSMQMKAAMNLDQLIRYHVNAANLPPFSKFA